MELLSRFYFLIRFRPGKLNTLADVLSRKDPADQVAGRQRMQILLHPDLLEAKPPGLAVALINQDLHLTDRLLRANRTAELLTPKRKEAEAGSLL